MDRSPLRSDLLDLLAGGMGQPVERVEVGARARLDDVRGRALARYHSAVEFYLDRHLADRVLAPGGRPQRVVLEPPLEAGDSVDGGQRRVDRAVAHARVLEGLP